MFERILGSIVSPQLRAAVANAGRYLESLPELRIYIAAAPGLGHHANIGAIIKRLVLYGFSRPILVICDDKIYNDNKGDMLKKLSVIFPELGSSSKFPITVTMGEVKVSFVGLYQHAGRYSQRTPLGISGGTDTSSENFAKLINVDRHLALQPYSFKRPNGIFTYPPPSASAPTVAPPRRGTIRGPRGPQPTPNFTDFDPVFGKPFREWAGYVSELPDETSVLAPTGGPGTGSPLAALSKVLTLVRFGGVNLCPVYGISLNQDGQVATLQAATQHMILFNLLISIRYAQDNGIRDTYKGAIVVVFAKIEELEWKRLMAICNGRADDTLLGLVSTSSTASFAAPGASARAADLVRHADDYLLNKNVRLMNIRDSELVAGLRWINENKRSILILDVGGVPQDLFNLVYRRATLPSVLEGASTANFALSCGKPHFRLGHAFPDPGDHTNAQVCRSASARLAATAGQWAPESGKHGHQQYPYYEIGEFLVNSISRGKPLRQYFGNLGDFYRRYDNDKLLRALAFVASS